MRERDTARGPCEKCGKPCRGFLCLGCFNKNGVNADPTEEELEAIIAEQMKCLPDWWDEGYGGTEAEVNDREWQKWRDYGYQPVRVGLRRRPSHVFDY